MIISYTEYNYLKNNNPEISKNLTYKTLTDRPLGHKRYFICSKRVAKGIMDKLNQSILKTVGKL